ncbi:MAG: pre-peptidase C-terminal domain-containing protein [Burkholderiales bacterium]|nr:pre-peptidase C-terminal domain-containing protein [Burkholderiales bacterium]
MSASIRHLVAAFSSAALLFSVSAPALAQGEGSVSLPRPIPLMAEPDASFLRVPPPPETVQAFQQGLMAVQATVTVNYLPAGSTNAFGDSCTAWTAPAQAAFTYAANLWGTKLQSSVPIVIEACFATLPAGVLGHAGPYTTTISGTRYPMALANAMNGSDLSPSFPDIVAAFSNNFTWYFGTDGNTPSGQYDFVSVVLHEIGHGLGFTGGMSVASGQGSWGGGGASAIPYAYDRFTENAAGQDLINTALFPNPSAALATQLTSGGVYFNGANANAANGGADPRVPLYAPATWNGGSSYSHLAESFNTSSGGVNSLMTYSLPSGDSIHDPGPVTLGIFRDLGWTLVAAAPTPGSLSLNLTGTASSIAVTTGSTSFSVSRTGGTSGAVSGNLGVTGGCTLSAASVSFADGSTTPSPATVTVSAGSAAGGATCTVSLAAVSPATTGTPSAHAVSVVVPDTTPNAFGFTSQTGLVPETTVTSNTITPAGYNTAAAISVANGTYSIGCSEAGFTSTAGTITPGQSVCVRHNASAGFGATVTTTLTIGGVAGSFSSTTVASLGTALSNGVAVNNLAGASGSSTYYYIDVPSGAASLNVVTSVGGRSTDLNLYVRRDGVPTTLVRDCASATVGTTAETCTFTNPPAGRYYILLAGMAPAGYGGVSLTATYVASTGSPGELSMNLTGTAGSIAAGGGSTTFAVVRTGGTSGAATANLNVLGGCTLGTASVSFASGSSTPSPATVTLSSGTASGGGSCTVGMSATGANLSLSAPVGFSVTITGTTPPPPSSTPLSNGVAVTGLAGATGSSADFYIDVPAGATSLVIVTSGGTGDVDLFVRRNLVPDRANGLYDCGSGGGTNAEDCSFTNPLAGRYHILLYGWAAYSGVSLTATYVAPTGSPGELSLNLTGTAGSIAAGTGSTTFAVARTGGTSGAATGNLSVIGGCTLSPASVSFASGSSTPSPATVTLSAGTAVGGGSCSVGLSATGAALSMTLPVGFMVTVTGAAPPPPATPLSNGVAVTGLSGATGSSAHFYIDVPSGATSLVVQTAGGSGGRGDTSNVNLYVRRDATPTTGAYDCASTGATSTESCPFTNPAAGRYYVLLYGAAAYTGASVVATYTAAPPPSPGELSLNLTGTAGSIAAGTGSTTFAVARTGGTSGAATGNLSVIGGCTLSPASVSFASGSSTPSPATVTLSAGTAVGGGSCSVGLSATGAALSMTLPVGFMVTVTGAAPPPPATPLSNGVAVTGLSGATGSSAHFYIDVPSGATSLVVQTAGGSGGRGDTSNVNLYVRRDATPTTGAYDCASTGATSTESCPFTNPAAGRYYVLLYGAAAYTGASVVATYTAAPPPSPGTLSLNTASTASSIAAGTGSTTFAVARTGGTSGAATGNLSVIGGCTLSTASVSFGDGSAVAVPVSVTLSAGTATGGSTCTVTLSATGATLGTPNTLAVSVAGAAPPPPSTPLANGVAVTGLAGATGSSTYFHIDVPLSSSLVIQTAGGSGGRGDTSNVNLYVRRDAVPTPSAYECASTNATSTENCTYISPPAARYHILLYGAAAYTGVSVQATFVALTGSPGALSLNLSGTAGSIAAGSGSTTFSVVRSGGTSGPATGNLNVIGGCTLSTASVAFADGSSTPSPATVTLFAGSAASGGSCTVGLSSVGATLASGAPVGFSVTITGGTPPPSTGTPLANGVPVNNLSGATSSVAYYYIDVPAGATNLLIQTTGGTGDVDLFVQRDTPPTSGPYDCTSTSLTTTEICSFPSPTAGRYFIALFGYSAFSGVSLQASYLSPVPSGCTTAATTLVPLSGSQQALLGLRAGESTAVAIDLGAFPLTRAEYVAQVVETASSFGADIQFTVSNCPGDFNAGVALGAACANHTSAMGGTMYFKAGAPSATRLPTCWLPPGTTTAYFNIRPIMRPTPSPPGAAGTPSCPVGQTCQFQMAVTR